MLELKNIKKDYPAGGETTLLNIIGGLDQYTAGDLIINGKSTKDRLIIMVTHNPSYDPKAGQAGPGEPRRMEDPSRGSDREGVYLPEKPYHLEE